MTKPTTKSAIKAAGVKASKKGPESESPVTNATRKRPLKESQDDPESSAEEEASPESVVEQTKKPKGKKGKKFADNVCCIRLIQSLKIPGSNAHIRSIE
jgi:hypothetical protein